MQLTITQRQKSDIVFSELLENTISLFPTNALVDDKIKPCLRELGKPYAVVRIDAIDQSNIPIDDSEACLPSQLFLKIDCRVILCNNTRMDHGWPCLSASRYCKGTNYTILGKIWPCNI